MDVGVAELQRRLDELIVARNVSHSVIKAAMIRVHVAAAGVDPAIVDEEQVFLSETMLSLLNSARSFAVKQLRAASDRSKHYIRSPCCALTSLCGCSSSKRCSCTSG